MKKVFKIFSDRVFVFVLLLVLQITLIALSISFLRSTFYIYSTAAYLFSAIAIMFIINKNDNPAYKILWILLISLFSFSGTVLYFLLRKENTQRAMLKRISRMKEITLERLPKNKELIDEIKQEDSAVWRQTHYLANVTKEPVWKNTATQYLPSGEITFEHLIAELKKAKKFIFLEYFIIEKGEMWNTILDILKEKVSEGVEVKLMYDDFGCINKLPPNYSEELKNQGIEVIVFNPMKPQIKGMLNNRSHRKITVIDGTVGFTGGINLADEYINAVERFGHWKDSAIMLKGAAVNNLTAMFLHLWHFAGGEPLSFDDYKSSVKHESDGYVLPFDDNPIDDDQVGEMSYLNAINTATRYVYITTPYLVVDNKMLTALTLAAQNGIDVRIITPHIPDKHYVFWVTRSYYKELIKAGVKIYEYTPGFIHSKTVVVDDEVATVGTANFDYRSFYLHFECGVWMYKSKAVGQVYSDFVDSMEKSQEITIDDCKKIKWYKKILSAILKIFAPLM